MTVNQILEEITEDIAQVRDPAVQIIIDKLLNIIELLSADNKQLREENQKLRDENNRLKGEKGKPDVRPQSRGSKDISSEADRKRRLRNKAKKSKKKKHKIKVNRVEVCTLNKAELPVDAVFKGYESVIVQDLVIQADNIEFKKQVYYSPSLKETFIAALPAGYVGDFGPGVKTLIVNLYHALNMTEPAIVTFLTNCGVLISAATVSRIITNDHEDFHEEKAAIVKAGLAATSYQHMDDTGARENGQNRYAHILCNPFFTAYFTRSQKSRLTLLEILTQGELFFYFNDVAFELMEVMGLPRKSWKRLKKHHEGKRLNRAEIDNLLSMFFMHPTKKYTTNKRIILEASAIAAYRQLPHAVSTLMCDDAPQFKLITEHLLLCWVHEGRHYKKLEPIVPSHTFRLEQFKEQFWDYYQKLLDFKEAPSESARSVLSAEFDALFSTETGYDDLDVRIRSTKGKKKELLGSLECPDRPLHNNAAELGARVQARKRDISFQTKNSTGTAVKDTFMTIVQTAKKLGVNTFEYFYDRISKKNAMPSLAELIQQYS